MDVELVIHGQEVVLAAVMAQPTLLEEIKLHQMKDDILKKIGIRSLFPDSGKVYRKPWLTTEKVKTIRERLKTAQSRQKSYADNRRRDLEFKVDDHVFVKVTPMKGHPRFGKRGHNTSSITWENCSRTATETTTALSYLHPAASTPIIHGDVKSTYILFDDNYIGKVYDFGASRLIPIDQSQLTTLVHGTLGYLDLVFGVVLVELLTGKKALSFARPEVERNLTKYFVFLMKEDHLFEIVDEQVMNEVKVDQLKKVSILAKRCLRLKGNEWPTMKEVVMELEGLRMMEKHPWVDDNKNLEETQYLLGDQLSDTYGGGTSVSNSRT
ncbi:wall-associated receptor kinase 5-like [Camellia sinensis]|uniref:wall-associated receptor kinase 5-like n=1 Tax=Camellia sinensis TaxID=4442 RepID=UPI001035C832|nr:wall-associated receptor kinase 5-like [Camellia sinensis]